MLPKRIQKSICRRSRQLAALLLSGCFGLIAQAAEQQDCYQGLCAKLSITESCAKLGESSLLRFQGSLAESGNFSISTYELLANANWKYLDNHQIQLISYDRVLSNDGFVIGGSFDKTIEIDPNLAERYTLIHRYRSTAKGFFAIATELSLDGSNSQVQMQLDIKPGSCPNPVNISNKGVTPVAIVGTAGLDVRSLDLKTIRLSGVAAVKYSYEDVTTEIPNKSSSYDCSTSNSDGIEDLALKFQTASLAAALEQQLGRQPFDGEILRLELTANTLTGTALCAQDNIQALVKTKKQQK